MSTNLSDLAVSLHGLAARCLDASSDESTCLVLELRALLKNFPRADQFGLRRSVLDEDFSIRINAGCALEACLMLIGREMGYMLSRSGHLTHAATVVIPGTGTEKTMTGTSSALAFTGALALALSKDLEGG